MAVHQNVLALEQVVDLRSPVRLAHSWCVGASDLRHAREPARCGTGLEGTAGCFLTGVPPNGWFRGTRVRDEMPILIDILQHIHSNPRKGWKQ